MLTILRVLSTLNFRTIGKYMLLIVVATALLFVFDIYVAQPKQALNNKVEALTKTIISYESELKKVYEKNYKLTSKIKSIEEDIEATALSMDMVKALSTIETMTVRTENVKNDNSNTRTITY